MILGPLRAASFIKPPACADLPQGMPLRPGRAVRAKGKLALERARTSRLGWGERAELLAGELGVHRCSLPVASSPRVCLSSPLLHIHVLLSTGQ